jgi:hypothetical protein
MPACQLPDGWVARAQVWLGTLVEVALPATEAGEARFAVAFAAIAQVHRTMSAHDSEGDPRASSAVMRIGVRSPFTRILSVVLELAQRLFRELAARSTSTSRPCSFAAARCPCTGSTATHSADG